MKTLVLSLRCGWLVMPLIIFTFLAVAYSPATLAKQAPTEISDQEAESSSTLLLAKGQAYVPPKERNHCSA